MTQTPIVKTEDLWGGYVANTVIRGVSLEINKGDFLGIIGPNGSGKSTLMKLMTRVLSPDKGRTLLEGRDVQELKLKDLAQKIAFVPQDTFISFPFTVEETVLLGRIPHLGRLQFETKKDFLAAEKAMELTDTASLKDKYIDELSAGERQRVFIARALAQEPSLLFLDEPTSHLDIGHQIQMLDLLKRLNDKNGMTVFLVLHDLNLASEYCDRIILLENGRIFKQGGPKEVLTYQNIETVYKTMVIVKENPVSLKPYVLLVSGAK